MEMCVTMLNQAEGSCCCALVGNPHWLCRALTLAAERDSLGKVGKYSAEHVGAGLAHRKFQITAGRQNNHQFRRR